MTKTTPITLRITQKLYKKIKTRSEEMCIKPIELIRITLAKELENTTIPTKKQKEKRYYALYRKSI